MTEIINNFPTLSESASFMLHDRYLSEGETANDMYIRVANAYADNNSHAERLIKYMQYHWFMPATPILSNGGTTRGLPISCFLNETQDSLEGIVDLWNENVWLASNGGGIGSYWGNLRSIGEKIKNSGKTSGVIPFMVVQDSLTLAISQGSLRRGSAALYLPIWHPEIEEFIDIRRPTGGDPNRKALNINNAVIINDEFMHAVENGANWNLISPKDNAVCRTINARDLWIRLLTARIETGEPYIIYIDTVNKYRPESYKQHGLFVKTSNLCSEIMLTTGPDHLNKERTAVCCLSSVNLEYYDDWDDDETFIIDIMRFLDNVLDDFIKRAPNNMSRATYSAMRERSVGLGVMGFHSYLQSKMVPFESAVAKSYNLKMFKYLKEQTDKASYELAKEKGASPDNADLNIMERFTHKMAIAPTASISIIAGNTSPGIEPYFANSFTQKTLSGSFTIVNRQLKKLLDSKDIDHSLVWKSITSNEGSIQHLDCLSDSEKMVFKTAFEIDQLWLIEHSSDRTPYICQGQSLNLFLPVNVSKKELHEIHMTAWKKGLKSLYYQRAKVVNRADKIMDEAQAEFTYDDTNDNNDDECLSCQ